MPTARPPDVPTPRWAGGGAAAAFLLVAVLSWLVLAGAEPVLRVDRAVSGALYAGDDRPAALEGALQVATAPGSTALRVLAFLPVVVWLVVRRRWWTAAWVATAVLLVGPLTTLVKESVGRVRPPFADGGATYASLALPSGHASGVATLVTVGLLLAWPALHPPARGWWLAAGLALAVLVGLTRLWLGVHWLSDVLAGWAFGLGWTLLTAAVVGRLAARHAVPASPAERQAVS